MLESYWYMVNVVFFLFRGVIWLYKKKYEKSCDFDMFYQNTHWNRSRTDFLHMYVHCILMNCNKYIIKQTLACIRNIWLTSKYYRQHHLTSRSPAIYFMSLGSNTHAQTGIRAILGIEYDVINGVTRLPPFRETQSLSIFCVFLPFIC